MGFPNGEALSASDLHPWFAPYSPPISSNRRCVKDPNRGEIRLSSIEPLQTLSGPLRVLILHRLTISGQPHRRLRWYNRTALKAGSQ